MAFEDLTKQIEKYCNTKKMTFVHVPKGIFTFFSFF